MTYSAKDIKQLQNDLLYDAETITQRIYEYVREKPNETFFEIKSKNGLSEETKIELEQLGFNLHCYNLYGTHMTRIYWGVDNV